MTSPSLPFVACVRGAAGEDARQHPPIARDERIAGNLEPDDEGHRFDDERERQHPWISTSDGIYGKGARIHAPARHELHGLRAFGLRETDPRQPRTGDRLVRGDCNPIMTGKMLRKLRGLAAERSIAIPKQRRLFERRLGPSDFHNRPIPQNGASRCRSELVVAMLLLGIETSCDDTATAVVRDATDVLSNVSTNQDAFHAKYGGIVPEIASRQHVALLSAAIEDALERAAIRLNEVDGIAVTVGPGLIGSLVVGVASAKALAFASGKPLYAVNHLHGHIFAPFLARETEPAYPFLALLVSGGHSQLVDVRSPNDLRVIGKTRDDAAGEAFDKTARLLGLGFPGGPALERLARDGNPRAHAFPRHRPDGEALDLSFSGVKTSVRYFLESPAGANANRADVAASFQAAVVDVLGDRLDRALASGIYRQAVLSGGVAANTALRDAFTAIAKRRSVEALVPELRFCTDNAAMIAAAADRQGEAVRIDAFDAIADARLPFETRGPVLPLRS